MSCNAFAIARFLVAFDKGVPLVNGNLCEYRHKSYIAKNRLFGLHFRHRQYGSITNLTQLALKADGFSVITQSKNHYAVQGHSRSPILVPMENPHATSYESVTLYLTSYFAQFPSYCRLLDNIFGAMLNFV